MTYSNGTITFNSALPGSYKVTVSDTNGKYADVTAAFTVSTSKVAAKYDSSSVSLKKAEGTSDENFANFLKNITSVKVGDKKYAATDKDAVTIINSNRYLDLTAEPFANMKSGSEYTMTVTATGYKDQEINVTLPENIYAYAAVPYDEYWKSEGVYRNEGASGMLLIAHWIPAVKPIRVHLMRFPVRRPTTVCIAAASSRVLLSTPMARIITPFRGWTAIIS